jgi:hypothetical protein
MTRSTIPLFLLLFCPLSAAQGQAIDSLPVEELCVLHSLTLATGEPSYAGSQQQIKEELGRRSEACEPRDLYMQAALQRAKNLQAKAVLDAQVSIENAKAAQLNHAYEQQMAAERTERRRKALQDFSNQMLNPPRARSTNCTPTIGGGMNCTTY